MNCVSSASGVHLRLRLLTTIVWHCLGILETSCRLSYCLSRHEASGCGSKENRRLDSSNYPCLDKLEYNHPWPIYPSSLASSCSLLAHPLYLGTSCMLWRSSTDRNLSIRCLQWDGNDGADTIFVGILCCPCLEQYGGLACVLNAQWPTIGR